MKKHILVVDDEESLRFTFERFLSDEGYEVVTAGSYAGAAACLQKEVFDLVITDIVLPDGSGIELLREIRADMPPCPVIMVTGFPNIETSAEAVRLGAFDYIQKPVTQNTLLHVVGTALRHKALMDENEQYQANLEAIFMSVKDGIITVDKKERVIEMNRVAESLCGLKRDEVLNKPVRKLPSGCSRKCHEALSVALSAKTGAELQRIECRQKNRPEQVISVSVSPLIGRHHTFSGAVMVLRDETQIVALESGIRERYQFHSMIGRSEAMQKIYTLIEQLADYQTTVLIKGESGTGKELIAEALHYRGMRSSKPLVKVNCAALPESLLESELFGHVKGAFTGAISDKVGRFQRADGGTIFLDEIGDIPKSVQIRLLRVLQEMEFERVGDTSPMKVDVRVIAATNNDLAEKIRTGEFREDLYFRLKVVELTLPPLRERREDIPLLVGHFIARFNEKFGKSIEDVSTEVLDLFMRCRWPGNIRELEHVIEHAMILCDNRMIMLSHLPGDLSLPADSSVPSADAAKGSEADMIADALKKSGGNKAKAARLLGMSRRTFYRKLETLGIEPSEGI